MDVDLSPSLFLYLSVFVFFLFVSCLESPCVQYFTAFCVIHGAPSLSLSLSLIDLYVYMCICVIIWHRICVAFDTCAPSTMTPLTAHSNSKRSRVVGF